LKCNSINLHKFTEVLFNAGERGLNKYQCEAKMNHHKYFGQQDNKLYFWGCMQPVIINNLFALEGFIKALKMDDLKKKI
jgi:hypothetical protein